MDGPPRWSDGLLRVWARHPRIGLALKAALAASLAWAVAQLVPGPAGDYPYYAPLGAVIATSTTLAGSVREAFQTVGAITLGAAVALSVAQLAYPNAVTIAVVVLAGVLLAGWQLLGTAGSWVATAALFTLVIGDDDPIGYVSAYAGLTLLGAVIGLGVTAAFPPLPLAPAQVELARLRELLAEQLDELVEGLELSRTPTEAEWRERVRSIDPVLAQMRSAVQLTDDARRGNRRMKRHQGDADRQYAQARALESLAFLVEDLTQLVAEYEAAELGHDEIALGPRLRPVTAVVLRRLAEVLRSVEDAVADPETTRAAYAAVDELVEQVRRERAETDHDLFVASSMTVAIGRCLSAVVPRELAEEEAPG